MVEERICLDAFGNRDGPSLFPKGRRFSFGVGEARDLQILTSEWKVCRTNSGDLEITWRMQRNRAQKIRGRDDSQQERREDSETGVMERTKIAAPEENRKNTRPSLSLLLVMRRQPSIAGATITR